jgi:hypothetical protein
LIFIDWHGDHLGSSRVGRRAAMYVSAVTIGLICTNARGKEGLLRDKSHTQILTQTKKGF